MCKKISIIVPCYNQAQYLGEALQSVLGQTCTNWECTIVNDGSSDNTEEIAKIWMAKDCRFRYLFQENSGLCSARNLGISHATGEFVLPLDADDIIAKDYVDLALQSFEKDDCLKVVYCKAEKFGDEFGIWQLASFSLYNLSRNNLIFCSAFFRKKDWELVGGYDTNMVYGWEDWEFWIAILKNGGNVKCLDEVGFYYRIKSNSMLRMINQENEKKMLNYLSVKHADFFVKHYGSFTAINHALIDEKKNNEINLKSEKFVIDVFCKRFFGFTVFGKYK
ncbi:glycosyltransferase family 2 protein [Flavobacterium sp. GT3P67]|uniref:glycosyltransferase family 2 protein n=1 Tax=Flavobacterium sp. GT3P67 TaxID=2541722 RepID=UPI00104B1105|nr:glycosyltransferase family A protein [Flavobacterium sp. GT3P67]TDE53943.1 glycosyltransferase family 2 protein [Flavobacterium sp. GT3P67]